MILENGIILFAVSHEHRAQEFLSICTDIESLVDLLNGVVILE